MLLKVLIANFSLISLNYTVNACYSLNLKYDVKKLLNKMYFKHWKLKTKQVVR